MRTLALCLASLGLGGTAWAQAAPAAPASAPPGDGPRIQLAPQDEPPPPPKTTDITVGRDQAPSLDLGSGRRIPVGSYGETHLVLQDGQNQIKLRRLVLFFGHSFADWASVYTELEVENLTAFEIEQAYLELSPFKKLRLGVRAGLVLMPIGIVNQFHEPPTFHGVDRPVVDQLIIPTTWRELGAGFFGTIVDGLHFQAYVVQGSDGSRYTAQGGFGPGLSRGFTVNVENVAVTGRLNFTRVLGLDVGVSGYYGTGNSKDRGLDGVRVGLVEADARYARFGLGLRAEYARFFISGADRITALLRTSVPSAAAVGAAGQGAYVEAAYNALYLLRRTQQEVIPFVRYDYVDPRVELPDVPAAAATPAQHYLTAGLTYRPRLELAFKFDYRRRLSGDDALGPDRYSFGIAFMY